MKFRYLRGDFIRLNEKQNGILVDTSGKLVVHLFAPEFIEEYGSSAKEAFVGEPVEVTLDSTSRIRRITPTLKPMTSRSSVKRSAKKGRQVVELLEVSLGKKVVTDTLHLERPTLVNQHTLDTQEAFKANTNLSLRNYITMAKSLASDSVSIAIIAATLRASGLVAADSSSKALDFAELEQSASTFMKLQERLQKHEAPTIDTTPDIVEEIVESKSTSTDTNSSVDASIEDMLGASSPADKKDSSALNTTKPISAKPTPPKQVFKPALKQSSPDKSSPKRRLL